MFSELCALSAIYEPVRFAFQSWSDLHEAVGGVGGVGGLCNLGDPKHCGRDNYCFGQGIGLGAVAFGLSPFAVVVLLLWNAPLFWACAKAPKSLEARRTQVSQEVKPCIAMWIGLCALWFLLPLIQYVSSPWYTSHPINVVLAVALAAAFPLSWHLSILAVPTANISVDFSSFSRANLIMMHKLLGVTSAIFAILHVGGELIFILVTSKLDWNNGENLLYFCGIGTAIIFVIHLCVAYYRPRGFKGLHGFLARIFLLAASAHWWPFALFLTPASAVHAVPPTTEHKRAALAAATIGNLTGFVMVWWVRFVALSHTNVDLFSPFIYPVAAVVVGHGVACICSRVMAWLLSQRSERLLDGA